MKGQVYWFFFAIFYISVKADTRDDDDDIIHPCQRNDLDCMRKFFAAGRHCSPPPGRVPDPYYRDHAIVYFPDVNITAVISNSKIRGLNGDIKEFHVNRRTKQLVIAIYFENIDVDSDQCTIFHHRRGRVPYVTSDWVHLTYQKTLITTTTPLSPMIDFRYTVVSAYSEVGNPPFELGPGISKHPSSLVQRNIATIRANTAMVVRDALFTQARLFVRAFAQNVLCGYDVIL